MSARIAGAWVEPSPSTTKRNPFGNGTVILTVLDDDAGWTRPVGVVFAESDDLLPGEPLHTYAVGGYDALIPCLPDDEERERIRREIDKVVVAAVTKFVDDAVAEGWEEPK